MYYYFDDIIKIEDFDFDNILLNEKSYKIFYDISYKTWIGAKTLCIMMNKVDRFIRVYDGTRYLVLFGLEKYDAIYNRIKYLISLKNDITYVFPHNYTNIRIDSYGSLPLEKTMTLHNVMILIKLAFNKYQNH